MRKTNFTIIELIILLSIVGMVVSIYARTVEPEWYLNLGSKELPYMIYISLFLFPILIYSNVSKAICTTEESSNFSRILLIAQAAFWVFCLAIGLHYALS